MWPLNHRTNQTLRPTLVDMEADINKPVFEVAESVNPWTVFLEICKPETPGKKEPLSTNFNSSKCILFYEFLRLLSTIGFDTTVQLDFSSLQNKRKLCF